MTLPLYLAMTAEEMGSCASLPAHCAYMACHFSAYGTGLSNLPDRLPPDSLLVINDRIRPIGADPQQIQRQLMQSIQAQKPAGILLDFQQPDCPEILAVTQAIVQDCPVPVAVSELYAESFSCPVFISMPPLQVNLADHAASWAGRSLWLDAALQCCSFQIRQSGSTVSSCPYPEAPLPLRDEALHCHYKIQLQKDSVLFTLQRTWDDLQALLTEGASLGIVQAVGLYQELKKYRFPTKMQSSPDILF